MATQKPTGDTGEALSAAEGAETAALAPATEPAPAPLVVKKKPGLGAYRSDIDGLRAVAVTAVVIFHIRRAFLPGGFLGVDVFYVISGYVVTGSLMGHPTPNYCEYFAAFYGRRLKRLTPALSLFVLIAVTLVPLLQGLAKEVSVMKLYYLSAQLATVGGANMLYALQEATYFDPDDVRLEEDPFLHCWSLGVEEQFYLLFPTLLLLLYPSRTIARTDEEKAAAKVVPPGGASATPVIVAAVLAVVSCAASFYGALQARTSPAWVNFSFYTLPFRFWQLASGAILHIGLHLHADSLAPIQAAVPRGVMAWPALVIFVLGFMLDGDFRDPVIQWLWAVGTTIAASLYILAGAPTKSDPTPELPFFHMVCSTDPVVFVGKISYQVYLWHWPTIIFAKQLLRNMDDADVDHAMKLAIIGVFILVSGALLPLVSYTVLEKPIREWRPEKKMPGARGHMLAIGVMGILMATTVSWVFVLDGPLGEKIAFSQSGTGGNAEAASLEAFHDFVEDGTADLSIDTQFGRSEGNGCGCKFPGIKTGDHMSQAATDDSGDGSKFCFSTYPMNYAMYEDDDCEISVTGLNSQPTAVFGAAEAAVIKKCLTPDRESSNYPKPTVFLLGDSHAGSLMPALAYAIRGVYQMRRFRTNTIGLIPHHYGGETDAGHGFHIDMYRMILATLNGVMMPGDIVVMCQFMGNWADNLVTINRDPAQNGAVVDLTLTSLEVLERDLVRSVLSENGGRLVILGDWPYFNDGTAGEPPSGDASAAVADVAVHAMVQGPIKEMAARNNNTEYMSFVPLFCEQGTVLNETMKLIAGGICSWNIPGTNINAYHNLNHLNTIGSIYMWPYLCDAMVNLGMDAGTGGAAPVPASMPRLTIASQRNGHM
jgi:peptidoglycan/LPS O-acetylase OafA/YrhL